MRRLRIQLTYLISVALRPEEIERFKADPEYFTRFRHTLEGTLNVGGLFISCWMSAFMC